MPSQKPAGPTTVAFYMNAIKKMVNEAIKAKILNRDDYPFGNDGYRPPRGNNTKKALPTEIPARAQVPLAFISQGLGHSSLKTTEQYLGSFEYDQTQKFLTALIPTKQESQDS